VGVWLGVPEAVLCVGAGVACVSLVMLGWSFSLSPFRGESDRNRWILVAMGLVVVLTAVAGRAELTVPVFVVVVVCLVGTIVPVVRERSWQEAETERLEFEGVQRATEVPQTRGGVRGARPSGSG
jgi:di/tricarboxylate transporter